MSAGNLGSKESQYLKEKENKEAIANFVNGDNDHYKINSIMFGLPPWIILLFFLMMRCKIFVYLCTCST